MDAPKANSCKSSGGDYDAPDWTRNHLDCLRTGEVACVDDDGQCPGEEEWGGLVIGCEPGNRVIPPQCRPNGDLQGLFLSYRHVKIISGI